MSERLNLLRQLFEDPSGNSAAVAAAIGIVVLIVLVIVLLLVAIVLPGPHERANEVTPEERKVRKNARAAATVAVLLGVVAASAAWYQATSTDRYCTQVCHQMAEPTISWRASEHSSVSCVRCHEGPPWLSFGRGVAGRVESLYLYVMDTEGNGRPVPAEICLDCHQGLLDEKMTALNGETYIHRDDYEEGRTCRSCHGIQGHVGPVRR